MQLNNRKNENYEFVKYIVVSSDDCSQDGSPTMINSKDQSEEHNEKSNKLINNFSPSVQKRINKKISKELQKKILDNKNALQLGLTDGVVPNMNQQCYKSTGDFQTNMSKYDSSQFSFGNGKSSSNLSVENQKQISELLLNQNNKIKEIELKNQSWEKRNNEKDALIASQKRELEKLLTQYSD